MKHQIFVMSNKGGVGKSTVAVNLAYSLSEKGYKIGLLDVDIHGPNVPDMLGLESKRVEVEDGRLIPIRFNDNLYVMSIAFLTESQEQPVIWRGPLKTKLINQFIDDVNWPQLDFLIVDLPPGTGDETITIMQVLKEGASSVIVSTPQEVSVKDSRKAINVAKRFGVPVAGLIENMSGEVFGSGEVEELAKAAGVAFLGRLDMDKVITDSSNQGEPFVANKEAESTRQFNKIIKRMLDGTAK